MNSSSVIINDILPYTQTAATSGQTVFSTTWTANAPSDINVYYTPVGDSANDQTQILPYPAGYSVAFIGSDAIVQVTLTTPAANTGDIVTITRMTPADRENLYTNTNFTPSMLNSDFGILTLVDQQAQLVNQAIAPRYNYSAQINTNMSFPTCDTILPLLIANETWVKNSNNTAFIPYTLPQSGIAPADDTYVLLTPDSNLPNSLALSTLNTGFMVSNLTGNTILTTSFTGTTNQITVLNGSGTGGATNVSISPNPILPGTAGVGIPAGTTAQRVIPTGTNINLRYNTTETAIEYYNGITWVELAEDFNVNPGLINQLAYYAATGSTVSGLATANNGVLITSGAGIPSISSTLPSGLTIPGYQASLTFPLAIALGGTDVTSVTIIPTVSSFAGWDSNKNLSSNNFLPGYTTTVTAAGTTTLTVTSTYEQFFTGTTTQTILMPVTSTLTLGFPFYIVNNSTGNVTVQSSGGNNIQVMAAGTTAYLTCILTTGTTAASWNCEYAFNGGSGSGTVNTGSINDLAFYAATGTAVSGLVTPTAGVLTSVAGVPTWANQLSLALGGTNAALTASNGGILYSTATAGAILSGTATAGLALLSGANATPTWSTLPPITKINTQTITATGAFTYTKTAGTQYAIFELQAGGGGSGGSGGGASQGSVASGGGGGAYQKVLVTGSANLAAITGSVGVGGAAGTSGNNAGGNGGNTTLVINSGSTWTAGGGPGGPGQAASSSAQNSSLQSGGTNTSGTNGTLIFGMSGGYCGTGFISAAATLNPGMGSAGGTSFLSCPVTTNALTGSVAGNLYGGGAAGGTNGTGGNLAGAAGAQGIVIVTEFISI